jgi:hypothetical protein
MVLGPLDHSVQTDIIFVIEKTAMNTYISELKTNYVTPTLE